MNHKKLLPEEAGTSGSISRQRNRLSGYIDGPDNHVTLSSLSGRDLFIKFAFVSGLSQAHSPIKIFALELIAQKSLNAYIHYSGCVMTFCIHKSRLCDRNAANRPSIHNAN
ncbi:hypothetical protein EYC80_000672 [Monilinia laxa]|uniref:Uncharacterized protein n=1 Tax=Monilinia laxa TaxID=61186 RepID=A0A5N6KBH1_MONLA|nr:hypothetical protein EYC80_000672 [Monilinia laxa]